MSLQYPGENVSGRKHFEAGARQAYLGTQNSAGQGFVSTWWVGGAIGVRGQSRARLGRVPGAVPWTGFRL